MGLSTPAPGNSGSGESTVVKFLLGILSINSGNIYIDDIDSNTYDNKWLKQKIRHVAQDSLLFSDTIAAADFFDEHFTSNTCSVLCVGVCSRGRGTYKYNVFYKSNH